MAWDWENADIIFSIYFGQLILFAPPFPIMAKRERNEQRMRPLDWLQCINSGGPNEDEKVSEFRHRRRGKGWGRQFEVKEGQGSRRPHPSIHQFSLLADQSILNQNPGTAIIVLVPLLASILSANPSAK